METSLAARAVITTAGIGIQGLARFGYTVAIGRILGPEALSDVSSVLSLAVFLALAWPSGAAIAASRYLPIDADGTARSRISKDAVIGIAVLAIAAAPIAWVMTNDAATVVGAVALTATYGGYVFVRGAMMGQHRIIAATVLDAVTSALAMGALVAVLLGSMTPLVLAPLAMGYGVFAIVGWPRTSTATTQGSRVSTGALRRFIVHTSLASVATGGLLPVTMLAVQLTDTQFAAGLFAAGLSLATPASLVSQAINQVLVPHFAVVAERGPAALRSAHLRAFLMTSAVFAVVFGAIIALAPVVLGVVYGEQYVDGAPAMQALLVFVLLISCMAAPSALLLVSGRERWYARIWSVAFVAGALTMLVASPMLGMAGAILGYGVGAGSGAISVIVAALVVARRDERSVTVGEPQ